MVVEAFGHGHIHLKWNSYHSDNKNVLTQIKNCSLLFYKKSNYSIKLFSLIACDLKIGDYVSILTI